MSTDGRYIFKYDLGYSSGSNDPMIKDLESLNNKYGGYFLNIDPYCFYWVKPKYTLLQEEIDALLADQILESKDGGNFEIVKPRRDNK